MDKKEEKMKKPTEPEEEVTYETKPIYLVIGVVGLIVLFFLLFFVGKTFQSENPYSQDVYNGFSFVDQGGYWLTQVEIDHVQTTLPFYYHPTEVESINYEFGAANKVLTLPPEGRIFITLDPEDAVPKAALAGVEISKVTGEKNRILSIETHSASTIAEVGLEEYPVVTCADANDFTVVIHMKFGETNLISTQENCIIMQATNEDALIKAADRFTYALLGIMEA